MKRVCPEAGSLNDLLKQTWLMEILDFFRQAKKSVTLALPFCGPHVSPLTPQFRQRLETRFKDSPLTRIQSPWIEKNLFASCAPFSEAILKTSEGITVFHGQMEVPETPQEKYAHLTLHQGFEILDSGRSDTLTLIDPCIPGQDLPEDFSEKITKSIEKTSILLALNFESNQQSDHFLNQVERLELRYIAENIKNNQDSLDQQLIYQAVFFPKKSLSQNDFDDLSTRLIDATMKLEEGINF